MFFSRSMLTELLPHNAQIVEAGAHVGKDTVKLARLFPNGHIHAFEPNPYIFKHLSKATQPYPNVTCCQHAVSDHIGTSTLHVSKTIPALSSLHEPQQIIQDKAGSFDTATVPTTTLDYWQKQHTITTIDFIWLDLQGHELAALHGAQVMLKKVKALLVEVNLEQRYDKQPLYPAIRSFLHKQGFEVYLEHLHHTTWGNVLFIKK